MSYYKYMVPVYSSNIPQRSLRSSSVDRTYSRSYESSMRQQRAASVGPSSFSYITRDYSAMPFTYSRMPRCCVRERAVTLEPVNTYSRAYYSSYGGGPSSFDYKVMDYAHRLDREETIRSYLNQSRFDNYLRNYGHNFNTSPRPFSSNYDYYSGRKYDRGYLYDTSKITDDFLHFGISKSTLNDRNQRAQSPLISREIDRYYKARPDFLGDVNPAPSQSFRHYRYRHVPYFGGSDYYQYVHRIAKFWNNEMYPSFVPV